MPKTERKKFDKATVPLDGHEYVDCEFDSCTFVYRAVGPVALVGNRISSDCRFVFEGSAADTVATMQAIYRMGEWGRQTILETFKQIAPGLKKLN